MIKNEISEMVLIMGKMIENMERLLEELRILQKDIQIRLDQQQFQPEDENSDSGEATI